MTINETIHVCKYEQNIHSELHIYCKIHARYMQYTCDVHMYIQDTCNIHARYMQYTCDMEWALAVKTLLVLLYDLCWSEGFGTMTMLHKNPNPQKPNPKP